MACPHVAGAAALVKQRFPTFTPAQIKAKLRATASDLGAPGNDPFYGAGLVDCNKATL
jgi:subtilisin family serine protease